LTSPRSLAFLRYSVRARRRNVALLFSSQLSILGIAAGPFSRRFRKTC